jgi:hypothetical protein
MICAAVRGEMAKRTIPDITMFIHANSGILLSVMPGQREHTIVVIMFTEVPMLPKPETISPSDQKS